MPFADHAGRIALCPEALGHGRDGRRQAAIQTLGAVFRRRVTVDPKGLLVAPGEQSSATGRAQRCGHVAAGGDHAGRGDGVDIGCRGVGLMHRTDLAVAEIVDKKHDEIGPRYRPGGPIGAAFVIAVGDIVDGGGLEICAERGAQVGIVGQVLPLLNRSSERPSVRP